MVEYWHWHSLHYGQETYWKGVLSHDLEPNRTYAEVTRVASELKRLGPELVDLKKDNKVAILVSVDSANALSYMPVSDKVNYTTVLEQMYEALYDLNIEADFVQAADPNLARYKVILVPPLYSASDAVLQQISDYVKNGGHIVMSFKSGFTDEHSTVRDVMAPGPLLAVCGFHYQEFTNLPGAERLTPDPYALGDQNTGSVWEEFLVPDTAEVVTWFDDPYWHFPAITRNKYGSGTLTYESTFLTDMLQRAVIKDALRRAGVTNADEELPPAVRAKQGLNRKGKVLHYYFNYSGQEQTFSYLHGDGSELISGNSVTKGKILHLSRWDVVIISEH
jgi:beta-galactosidase